jgi:hypothetical protein
MDLPTHFFFGLAIGFVFFGRQPEYALLIGLGALLPDLDREYWFIPPKQYAEEQRHRALLHNVVVIALTFAVSPFLSLGVFLHVLQDSFTTVKDRGVEWFYPFTRLAKRGRYDAEGNERPLDPAEHVYFYQEDPPGLVKFADTDLQEEQDKPIPWRRVYGFALNSHLLDRGFLFGSVAVLLVWLFVPTPSLTFPNLSVLLQTPPDTYGTWSLGLVAVATLFLAGEIDRRDVARPVLGKLTTLKIPIFVIGIVLLGGWVFLYRVSIGSNISIAVAQPIQIVAIVILIPVIAVLLIWQQTRRGKEPTII